MNPTRPDLDPDARLNVPGRQNLDLKRENHEYSMVLGFAADNINKWEETPADQYGKLTSMG